MSVDDGRPVGSEDGELSPADQRLYEALSGRLVNASRPVLALSSATVQALERACGAVEMDRALAARLQRQLERAALDAEFEADLAAKRRRLSLGAYMTFLRDRTGRTVSEAARELRVDFQWLADLERDAFPPGRIPAGRLAAVLRKLHGSLEMAERALLAAVRAPRRVPARAHPRLYRGAPGASRAGSEAASAAAHGEDAERVENPAYREGADAARRLIREVRARWRG